MYQHGLFALSPIPKVIPAVGAPPKVKPPGLFVFIITL